MKFKISIAFLLISAMVIHAQDKKSKADNFFYEYQYEKAITEYVKDMQKTPLSNPQLLNLADAYFNTGKYEKASELYLEVNKNDTIMSVHRFNKMLQSLSKDSNTDRVRTFLRSKADVLSTELLENAEFNYSLLERDNATQNLLIKGLGSNSPQGDFSPAFHKDGLLFSSSRNQNSKKVYAPSGESYLNIYSGKLMDNGDLSQVEAFDKIPSSPYHKATPFYSDTLATYFYILSNTDEGELAYDDNGKNALAIGMYSNKRQFTFLLKDLSTSFYYPFYDEKTQRLYFAANFDNSYGGTDLYYVAITNGQIMSAPINLGPRINSPGNEISPFILDGDLYFSSDVFYGLGGMDIYKSSMLVDGFYTIPVNLGEGINSVSDDFGLILKQKSETGYSGYFASNRKGGKGGDDIYTFTMKEIPGLKTFATRGKVVNQTNSNGLDRVRIRLLDGEGTLIKETLSAADGTFRVEVPWLSQVTLEATKEGYSIFTNAYSGEEMERIQNTTFTIGLAKLQDLVVEAEDKTVLKLNKFYFDKGRSTINTQVETELKKVIDAVASFPNLRLRIETHTDSRGSDYYNKKLSQERSTAIKQYLLKNGLSTDNIVEAIGYGEERLRNNCVNGAYCLDFLHTQNERTLIVVLD